MYGSPECGAGRRMRMHIGPILTTITTTAAGNTTRATGTTMTTAITTIGTMIAIATRLYPGLGRKAGPCHLALQAAKKQIPLKGTG